MSGCVICGSAACDGHHPTGTDAQGTHLDPDLTLPVCHDDHEQIHDDLRTLELHEPPSTRLSRLERLELRLRRLAVVAGRFAGAHPEWKWAASLAHALSRWADDLAAELRARDARDPGWRDDPAFYPEGA